MKSHSLLFGPYSRDGLAWSNFGAPSLGVHRIASHLRRRGHSVDVIDPDLEQITEEKFREIVTNNHYGFIGISPTHLTLENDLALVFLAKKYSPNSVIVAGGQEATFAYNLIFDNSPVNIVVRGEGERPMLAMTEAVVKGSLVESFGSIDGLVIRENETITTTGFNRPLTTDEFAEVTLGIDFGEIPYDRYWERTRGLYESDLENPQLRAKRFLEIYAMRLFQTNYCPYKCAFCSSTNFQNSAGNTTAKVVSLTAEQFIEFIERAYVAYPQLKSILVQDDNFMVGSKNSKIKSVTAMLRQRREEGLLPKELSFICQSRVDTVTPSILGYLRDANFRMIGYGVESFSRRMLDEFGKRVGPQKAEQTITNTLSAGITPYINVILTAPKSTPYDMFFTIDRCVHYLEAGAEVGAYICVIPLPGSKMAEDPNCQDLIESVDVAIPFSDRSVRKSTRIMPRDPQLKEIIYRFYEVINDRKTEFMQRYSLRHIPARINTLITFSTLYAIAKERGIPKYGAAADKQVTRIEKLLSNF